MTSANPIIPSRRNFAEDYFGPMPEWRQLSPGEAALFPYSAVCQIQVWNSRRKLIAAGTGWLAGSATVITAAHVCVFGRSVGGYNVLIRFPSPSFQVWAADLQGHDRFNGQPGSPYDIAALRLPGGADRHPLALASARRVQHVEVPGFPQGGNLTTHSGPVVRLDGHYLLHQADTFGGHSGAPILARARGGGASVVGVHLGGFQINPFPEAANIGLSLDEDVGNFVDTALRAWG